MIAAAVACARLTPPCGAGSPISRNRRVYGEGHAPDEALRTFGARMSRASRSTSCCCNSRSRCSGRCASRRPKCGRARTGARARGGGARPWSAARRLTPEERRSSRTARVRGPRGRRCGCPRSWPGSKVASAHRAGDELRRAAGSDRVRADRGRRCVHRGRRLVLTELARQVGLALHNVKLDSALQESLDEVRSPSRRAAPHRVPASSRPPTPSAAGSNANLHDGAQQHLVALAVKLRLARQIADTDPEQAKAMLDQIGLDLQEAVQELRKLAHGIYPPLLMDRGLPRSARAPRPAARCCRPRSRPTSAATLRGGGRGVLLLPRSDAERGQARGRGRARVRRRARGRRRELVLRGRRRRRRLRRRERRAPVTAS